ncbi:farnesol dehydrogenase-like [Condylostylus longicornis]|uniref:farnesol dehydrogenase-like n=1 Tax=Condylostylus longicornis TaxID=2530218 RepID=UPI00244DA585|nr:farnesol dehydrogenase-like [Condylostylus longicornis]
MNRLLNKIAVVTGSGSGIGQAISKELLHAKATVIGLDKNHRGLEDFKLSLPSDQQKSFDTIKCDVRDNEEINKIFSMIFKNYGRLDFLINSAGILRHGNLIKMPLSDIRETLDTLVMGAVNCTRHAFRYMQENKNDGHIIFINSINGHKIPPFLGRSIPTTNMYTPSKYAITAMIEVLRQELLNSESNVKVTGISPGLTETPIVPEFLLQNPHIRVLQPKDVADCVIFALNTPPHVQVHELIVLPLGGIL